MTKVAADESEQDRTAAARDRVCKMTFATSHASLDDFETLGEADWEFPPADHDFGGVGH